MDYMTLAVATNVFTGDGGTISDLLSAAKELDVSSLKKDSPDSAPREFASEAEADDARMGEVQAIEDFIKANGVTKPTAEDFKPKKRSWGSKKSAKAGRRGRPRKSFTKDLAFVQLDDDTFKRAGRGRAKKGEVREVFTIFHSNIDKACAGTHTREALTAMANC